MTGGELTRSEVSEMKPVSVENYRNIKPEKEMSPKELNDVVKGEFSKVARETVMSDTNSFKGELGSEQSNMKESDKPGYYTTSEERKAYAGGSHGEWEGEVGDSKFRPDSPEAQSALRDYHQDAIDYNDGEPDFSKVSEATVEIDNMTKERYGTGNNFDQADHKCAEKWNQEARDGKTDWTARDVENWRTENRYSWHERLDRKTMDLVQRDVHAECKHFGGVAECKRQEKASGLGGGKFDE